MRKPFKVQCVIFSFINASYAKLHVLPINTSIKLFAHKTIKIIWFSYAKNSCYMHVRIFMDQGSCSQLHSIFHHHFLFLRKPDVENPAA